VRPRDIKRPHVSVPVPPIDVQRAGDSHASALCAKGTALVFAFGDHSRVTGYSEVIRSVPAFGFRIADYTNGSVRNGVHWSRTNHCI